VIGLFGAIRNLSDISRWPVAGTGGRGAGTSPLPERSIKGRKEPKLPEKSMGPGGRPDTISRLGASAGTSPGEDGIPVTEALGTEEISENAGEDEALWGLLEYSYDRIRVRRRRRISNSTWRLDISTCVF